MSSFYNRSYGAAFVPQNLGPVVSAPAPDASTWLPVAPAFSPASFVPAVVDPKVDDHNFNLNQGQADTVAPPGFLDGLGDWLWIVPAGVVAVALGAYFFTHRKGKMAGYRRRRRSRR